MYFNIISVDEIGVAKHKLAALLKDLNINIIDAKDEVDVQNLIIEKKFEIHAILWAFNSIDSNCFTVIKSLKSKEPFKKIPLIIVSKFTDKRFILKAIESGAGDYIAKPYDETTIRKKICKILGISMENTLIPVMDDDILIFNFSEMFSREIKAAGRGSHALSVLLATAVQKDGKNLTNAADMIQVLSMVLKTKLREIDTVFRYSNDSLIILLPFTDKSGTAVVQKKICDILATHSVLKQKNTGCTFVMASVSYPEDGKIKDKLLRKLEENFNTLYTSHQASR